MLDFTATNGTSVIEWCNASDVICCCIRNISGCRLRCSNKCVRLRHKLTGSAIELDCSGDITIDASGIDTIFKDDGTEFGRITNSSSDFVLKLSR